jgi:hypothetical protein
MTALGDHATAELTAINAPTVIKDPLILIVGTFADVPNPETNWPLMREYLERLLAFGPLTPLTNNPAEWSSQFTLMGEIQIWQSERWPDAWTKDPDFSNYFLISELSADGTLQLHPTVPYTP